MSSAQRLEAATTVPDGFERHGKDGAGSVTVRGTVGLWWDGMCGVTMASDVASHLRVHCPVFWAGSRPRVHTHPRGCQVARCWPPLSPQTFRLKYFALFIQHVQNIQHWVIIPQ